MSGRIGDRGAMIGTAFSVSDVLERRRGLHQKAYHFQVRSLKEVCGRGTRFTDASTVIWETEDLKSEGALLLLLFARAICRSMS
jgi:hypothetical protein